MTGPVRRPLQLLLPLGVAFVASCAVVHHAGTTSTGAGGAGGSATAGTGGSPETGRSLFESTVKAEIMTQCGACHQLGGIADVPFLAGPDVYVSITTWPGFIVSNPDLSTLLTHPADPTHGGGMAPNLTPDLHDKVRTWLAFEAAHLPVPEAGSSPLIQPFKPFLMGAFNAIYLDSLGPAFKNSSLTFNAAEAGTSSSLLVLENLQVHPVAGVDLHLVHPLFTVYQPAGAEIPDTADSFSGLDATYTLTSDPTLGTGSLVLSHWAKDARLSIAFEKIEITSAMGGANACKDVATFQSTVVPQLKMWPCAGTCHGGTNVAAQQQMDLSGIDAMPPDVACSQVRARIKPGDPANSEILIVTDPTKGAVHLFKFAGNLNNYNSFKAAVTPWINAEQ